ncbi:hypothetical protein GCM10010447_42240 [Streptomyces fulvorobeus]
MESVMGLECARRRGGHRLRTDDGSDGDGRRSPGFDEGGGRAAGAVSAPAV